MLVRAGRGGNGSGSFARDNRTSRGKADGGNGGEGGNVFVVADRSLNNLNHVQQAYKAGDGDGGAGTGCYGARGKDLTIAVPAGTVLYRVEGETKRVALGECDDPTLPILVARGGKGGRGNRTLRTNNHEHEKGQSGESLALELDLNTIADFGLIGLPNAGKSSFLASISRTTPKIAPYPFTTLHPNIGTTTLGGHHAVSIADIPGLIEGAHQNVGLGHEFLKHIIKSKHLILIVDASTLNPCADGTAVVGELELYRRGLAKRIAMVLANKIDRLEDPAPILSRLVEAFAGWPVIPYSAKYKVGLDRVKEHMNKVHNTG